MTGLPDRHRSGLGHGIGDTGGRRAVKADPAALPDNCRFPVMAEKYCSAYAAADRASGRNIPAGFRSGTARVPGLSFLAGTGPVVHGMKDHRTVKTPPRQRSVLPPWVSWNWLERRRRSRPGRARPGAGMRAEPVNSQRHEWLRPKDWIQYVIYCYSYS